MTRGRARRAHIRSRLIHGKAHTARWDFSHHLVPPISSTATFRLDTAARGARGFQQFAAPTSQKGELEPIYIYDRLDEPTRGMLEDNLAEAEGGETAVTFASGMGGIAATFLVLLQAGDTVLAHERLYGCTYSLLTIWLKRLGVRTQFIDMTDLGAVERAIHRFDPRVIYFETPVNPTLELIEIGAIRRLRGRRKAAIVVDNTFATPFCQRPLEHGADVVVHSLTKSLGGFGTILGGAVIAPKKLESDLFMARKDFGAVLSGHAAWSVLVYGLPTLGLRIREQEKTAGLVAEMLLDHPRVKEVRWPGLDGYRWQKVALRQMQDWNGNFAPGTMLYFVLKGSAAESRRACERLIDYMAKESYSVTLAVSLGQIRTLIEHPASMTHAMIPAKEQRKHGIDPAGIRLSIGLEDPRDIIHDLSEALRKA